MNPIVRRIAIAAMFGCCGVWCYLGAGIVWAILTAHSTLDVNGTAVSTSWDLRSIQSTLTAPPFFLPLVITIVAFFAFGFWLDGRFLSTPSQHRPEFGQRTRR
jgi:hypothetical protein